VIADPGALEPFKLTEKARSVIARALTIAAADGRQPSG
jgi:hypothetical protein